jgi:hypothetical protein
MSSLGRRKRPYPDTEFVEPVILTAQILYACLSDAI